LVISGSSFILAKLSWIGSGGIFVSFILNRISEPSLEFSNIITYDKENYFIAVRTKGGKHKAEECEGWIKIGDIHVSTVWALNEPRLIEIGEQMNLRLFEIEGTDWIVFPSARLKEGYEPNKRPFNEYINKQLTVWVNTKRGREPNPYQKTIAEIIKLASSD